MDQEAIRCLKDRFDRHSLTHQDHIGTIVQAPLLKANNERLITYALYIDLFQEGVATGAGGVNCDAL